MLESPQSFVTRQECEKLSHQNGFRRQLEEAGGWRRYGSTTAQGSIWLAYQPPETWILAVDHAGVIAELDIQPSDFAGPGLARYKFATLGTLYAIMPRIYGLALSLPDAPLQQFIQSTQHLPKETEAQRLVIQRVGQNIFRERLLEYWQGQCPMTGITDHALLRASHIKPWKDCDIDDERLDVHNGLLLSALWDAAFDGGFVTLGDDGIPIFSDRLSEQARAHLHFDGPVHLTGMHRTFLVWHRTNVFDVKAPQAPFAD